MAVNIADFVAQNFNPQRSQSNALGLVQNLQSAQGRNALLGARTNAVNEQTQHNEDIQNALAGGDVNALSQVDPGVAGQLLGVQDEQTQQAAQRFSAFTSQVARSPNAKALAATLMGSPEFKRASETLGIDLNALGDISEFDDDQIRQTALELSQVADGFLGNSRFGAIGDTDLPSDVRSALAFQQGDEDFQNAFLTSKRSRQIEDIAGVPTDITGSGSRPLSTAQAEAEAAERQTSAETRGKSGGKSLTPGQLAVDRAFSSDFVAWQAGGGFADVEKNVSQIQGITERLQSGKEELSGPGVGNQPRRLLAITNPDALNALEQVEEVVQRNLRLILGAQFTENEGERLISRAYNPLLEEGINAKRLQRLSKSLTDAAKAKQAAAEYFSENGTLSGWKGTLPSLSTVANDVDNSETLDERVKRLRAEVEELERGER